MMVFSPNSLHRSTTCWMTGLPARFASTLPGKRFEPVRAWMTTPTLLMQSSAECGYLGVQRHDLLVQSEGLLRCMLDCQPHIAHPEFVILGPQQFDLFKDSGLRHLKTSCKLRSP